MVALIRLVIIVNGLAWGQEIRKDNPPPAEALPAPQKVDAEPSPLVLDIPPTLPYERRNRYQVWDYYAVDRQGFFRPRVIMAPYENYYYLYNGAPYPFARNRSLNFMPYVND